MKVLSMSRFSIMKPHSRALHRCPRHPVVKAFTFVLTLIAGGVVCVASAGGLLLEWDPVPDGRVAHYELHYGLVSGDYETRVATRGSSISVTGLEPGETYYFAARACADDGTTCSGFSNEVSAPIPHDPPVAGLEADAVVGVAPLTVNFVDRSSGAVSAWGWDFGDGTGADIGSPQHTYSSPGNYSVTLAVTGPGGDSSVTRTDYITVLPPAPVASFTASTRFGFVPLTVTFTCTSEGAIAERTWDFGGEATSAGTTAVHTFASAGVYDVSLQVKGPGGSDTEVKSAFIEVKEVAPVAEFTADVLSGPAPLRVGFSNLSSGVHTSSQWSFGDGENSDQTHPSHTYTQPGLYAVTLSVTGPGGEDSLTRSAYVRVETPQLPMEVGELEVNHVWQRVSFSRPFVDPILIANPLSANGGEPAVIRVRDIDAEGFWVRLQEWDYLDGRHIIETVTYLALERGRHQLPDGRWVEAGRLMSSATNAFVVQKLSMPLDVVPVVFATVTSINEADAVAVRLRGINAQGFEVGMQEQQANQQHHLAEHIDYIAWEPSFGVVNGLRYAVGLMDGAVSNAASTLVYPVAFGGPPMFLAEMQTTVDRDPASVRWRNRNEVSVDLRVAEETSSDSDVKHAPEQIGYFLAEEEP